MGPGGGGSSQRAPRKSPIEAPNPAGRRLIEGQSPSRADGLRVIGRPASSFLVARQRFRDGDDSDTEAHQEHLRQARPRVGATVQAWDQAGHGNVKESRCRQGQGIRQRLLSLIQAEIGDDAP